jgi:hypothetical protein
LLEEHPGEIITLTKIFMIFASVMLFYAVLPLYAFEKMPHPQNQITNQDIL